jgi:CBS domain-containing protein
MYSVKDILDEKGYGCTTVEPETTVYEALKRMAGKGIGALIVLKDNKVNGVFSERDFARKTVLKGKISDDTKVDELVTEALYMVKPTTRVIECMELMTDHRVRHLPVIDGDKLIGIVSIGDIVNKIIQDQKKHIQHLEDYITGKS